MKHNYEKPFCEVSELEPEGPLAASAPDYEDGGDLFSSEYLDASSEF